MAKRQRNGFLKARPGRRSPPDAAHATRRIPPEQPHPEDDLGYLQIGRTRARGVPAAEMSVAESSVVSVMRPAVITGAPGGRAGVPQARPEPTGLHLVGQEP